MKHSIIIFLLAITGLYTQAQITFPKSVLEYRGDTIKFWKQGGSAELKLQNATRNVKGTLVNVGDGVTQFIKPKIINGNDLIIGLDTLQLPEGGEGGPTLTEDIGIEITPDNTIKARYPLLTSASQLRNIVAASTSFLYRAVIYGIPADFYYDPSDVSTLDDGVTRIRTNDNRTLKRYIGNSINAKWWGAVGDGVHDDWPNLQAASDWCIANPEYTRNLDLPRGVYKISQPWTFYKWNGTNYEFFSINVQGERVGNFTRTDYSTVIKPTFTDKSAVEFQLAKTSAFRGIYISGPADGVFNWDQKVFVRIPFETFMQGLSADSRHAAQCAIVIDPYTQSLASKPTDSYPGRTSWYRGPGSTGGSSDVTVEDCRLYGFTIGVGISLNGVTRNAELVKVLHSSVGYAKVAIASGQDQTKNNVVRDLVCWDFVHTVFDNNTYGEGVGTNPYVTDVNIAGHVNRLANIVDAGRYGAYFKNIFAESMFRIGTIISQAPSTIETFQFDFSTSEGADMPSPDNYLQAENLTLRSGQLRIYDNSLKRIHMLGTNNVVFQSCTFQNMPVVKNYNQAGNVTPASFYNCNFNIAGGTVGTRNLNVQRGTGEAATVLGFPLTIQSNTNFSFGEVKADYNDLNSEALIDLEITRTVTVNTTSNTATVNLPFPAGFAVQVGDYLRSENDMLGRVQSNDGENVVLDQIPVGLTTGSKPIYLSYIRRVQTPFVGDVTLGSLYITNVETFAGYPAVGDRIENPLFGLYKGFSGTDAAVGAYITEVNPGAKTVKVNFGPTASATGVDFAMGNPKYTIANRLTPDLKAADNPANVFFKNTLWTVRSPDGADQVWKFTKTGYLNAAGVSGAVHQAEWTLLDDFTPSDVTWSRITDNKLQFSGATSHTEIKVASTIPGTAAYMDFSNPEGVGARFQINPGFAFSGTYTPFPYLLYSNSNLGLSINTDGTLTAPSLGGGGTQMVVADNDGNFSVQAIPSGGGGTWGGITGTLSAQTDLQAALDGKAGLTRMLDSISTLRTLLEGSTAIPIGFGLVFSPGNVLEVDPSILYSYGTQKELPDAAYVILATDRHLVLPATTTTRNITLPDPTTTTLQEVVLECRANTSTAWKIIGTYIAAGTITTGTTFSTVTDQYINSNETLRFKRVTLLGGTNVWFVSNK